jgi:hypothetical protein
MRRRSAPGSRLSVLGTGFLVLGLVALVTGAYAQPEPTQVGVIDFFGYKGIDLARVRTALPLRVGDTIALPGSDESKAAIRAGVRKAIGRDSTDESFVCCEGGKWLVYVGLPGASSKPVAYNPVPKGDARFSPGVARLHDAMGDALLSAVKSGDAREDRSQGFALSENPALRAAQMAIREHALANETEIFSVLESSADAEHRAMAATALGYSRASSRQVAGLARASLDADDNVRNNAVRALGVLLQARPEFARDVPAASLLPLLSSPVWSDHNKGVMLVEALTKNRDPELLRQLRASALDNLLEMARWHSAGHAASARMLLGRIAGIEEGRLLKLVASGDVEAITRALSR